MDTQKFSNEYLDLYDTPSVLTQEELSYFQETVNLIRSALGVSVPIYNRDHERDLWGKHKDAYGLFYTSDPKDPAADCFITIDNYFIHECYEAKFHGKWSPTFETLERAICHEIAHMVQFRHCKRHTSITEEYLKRVEAYQAQSLKPTLAEQIAAAGRQTSTASQSHKKIYSQERM